jgi:hypothetical protein
VSFNNDEDGDGLAALFGGITPQATPKPAEEARPAVAPAPVPAQPPAAQQPAAPQPAAAPPAGTGYPASGYPVAPAAVPGYAAPTSYDLPAPSDAPASGYPSAAQYPGLAPAPTAAPQYPGLAPQQPVAPEGQQAAAAPPPYATTQSPAPDYPPTQYPATQQPATQPPPNQYGAPEYPPTQNPVAPYPASQEQPAQYPPVEYPAAQYPSTPYPATSQYPGLEPDPGASVPPSYDLPAPAGQAPGQYDARYGIQETPPVTPQPLTEPPGVSDFRQSVADYPTPVAADFADPVSYDLPAPAAAPSTPTYNPGPTYDPAPEYDPASGYQQPVAPSPHEATASEPPQAAPGAPQQFGGSAYNSSAPVAEAPVGAALSPAPVVVAGPLLPSRTAVVTPEDLERATVGEKIGLALAILTGPLGLIIAIVSAIRSGRRRGWLIGISRVSLVLGVLSTIATIIVGIVGWNIRVDQIQHDGLATASAEFCAAAEADPSMVTPPTLGFPPQGKSIPDTIDAMTAWTTRWTELAATSPAELRTGLELLAAKGQTIVDSVTDSRSVDDVLNAQVIGSVQAQSGVPAWYENYCVTP